MIIDIMDSVNIFWDGIVFFIFFKIYALYSRLFVDDYCLLIVVNRTMLHNQMSFDIRAIISAIYSSMKRKKKQDSTHASSST